MALPMVNLSGLVSIPIVSPAVSRNICVIRQKGAGLAPLAQRFLSVLTKVVSELRQDKG